MTLKEQLFSPIKSKRTFEEISSEIKRLIFDGVLKPGDRLPSETELASQFSVGRQTIREALRILELSGFLTVQKGGGGGPLIKDTILNTIGNLFLDAFRMEKISLEEITDARLDIEKVVLNHVIDNAEESDLTPLEENVRKAREKIDNNLMATKENIEFHNLLARASNNHVLVIVVESILAVLRDLMSRMKPDLEKAENGHWYYETILKSGNAVRYHEELMKAIASKDKDRAGRLLEDHILEVKERIHPYVKKTVN